MLTQRGIHLAGCQHGQTNSARGHVDTQELRQQPQKAKIWEKSATLTCSCHICFFCCPSAAAAAAHLRVTWPNKRDDAGKQNAHWPALCNLSSPHTTKVANLFLMSAHVTRAETENSELLKAPGKRSKLFFFFLFGGAAGRGGQRCSQGGGNGVSTCRRDGGDVHGYHHVKRFRELPPVTKEVDLCGPL